MKNLLNESKIPGLEEIFVSANPESFIEHSTIFYSIKNSPVIVNL